MTLAAATGEVIVANSADGAWLPEMPLFSRVADDSDRLIRTDPRLAEVVLPDGQRFSGAAVLG
jgi:hypothetical protein